MPEENRDSAARVAGFIAACRRRTGMTQQQVADRLHISAQAVSKWETGTALPQTELLLALARLLGVTTDELLEGRTRPNEGLTYRKAGVDIGQTDAIKRDIAPYLRREDPRVLNGMGAFASLYDIRFENIPEPLLVLKAEEPGSKQKLAMQYGYMESVCHDMINHLVNDIAVMGARPLAVLDTVVCGQADRSVIRSVVKGISEACRNNYCTLVGGETSVQPNVLDRDTCILTASIAGIVDRSGVVDGSAIRSGDVLIAVASNGLHSNGYSLVRKLMDLRPEILSETVGGEEFLEAVMKPHAAYYPALRSLTEPGGGANGSLHGMAHITGGGIPDNVRRIIPEGLCAEIDLDRIRTAPLFALIKEYGAISEEEMLRTFNCGVGLVIVAEERQSARIMGHIERHGHDGYILGAIKPGRERLRLSGTVTWR